MGAQKNTIILNITHKGETHQVQTYPGEHHSLMTLISDNLAIPGFGLCCGMGSCGTCLVHIADKFSAIKRPVLACGIQINDELANTTIIVPDVIY